MTTHEITTAPAFRAATLSRADEEGRYRLSLSSEAPVVRSLYIDGEMRRGQEVLSHRAEHVDLGWIGSGRAPLLLDHAMTEQIGVIRSARLDGDRLVGEVEFSRAARAQEIRQDVDDGIRSAVSIGYEIREIEHTRQDGGLDEFRVVSWRPFEGSIVSIPADPSVGVGRNTEQTIETIVRSHSNMSETTQPEKTPAISDETPPPAISADELARQRAEAAEREQTRIDEILTYGRRFNLQDMASKAVRDGTPVENFRGMLLEHIPEQTPIAAGSDLGMSRRDKREYSLVRLMRALSASGTVERRKAEEEASLELEVSQAYAERVGRTPRGAFVPIEAIGSRILSTAGATTGDHLVGTDHLASEFIESLENQSAVMTLGARSLMGLEGNVVIPRRTAGSTAAWLSAEDAEAAESDSAFDEVTLSPKDLAYFTSFTRRLLLQSSPDVEALARQDVFRAISNGIDAAAINGAGTATVPQGIVGASGAGSQSLATLNYANVLAMEEDVLAANAGGLPGMAFLSSARGMRRFAETAKDTGSGMFLLDRSGSAPAGVVKGTAIGYPFGVSQNVPDNLSAGNDLTAVIFGAFSQVLIGMWGGLDIIVDPYTESRRGRLRMTVMQTADVALRHSDAFCVASDLAATNA